MPPLNGTGLWPAQVRAVENLERSLAEDRPRALIQMSTGSGKTFTAITSVYRLVKHAGARRVLFLVDRANLGRQAHKEFQQYTTPDDGRKFTELYNVQLLSSNRIDPVARVFFTTIQRLYSMLRGEPDLDPPLEEGSQFATGGGLVSEPVPVAYNAAIPVETFDVVFVDECWERLDEDLTYSGDDLDREVVALDQIRTVVRTFRDRLFTEIFPGRREVPSPSRRSGRSRSRSSSGRWPSGAPTQPSSPPSRAGSPASTTGSVSPTGRR